MRTGITGSGVFLRADDPAGLARWYGETLGLTVDSGAGAVTGTFRWRDADDPDRVGQRV